MKNIEVSIVIPVYNGMPYLKDTIDSILAQTYKNFELIVIDDGGLDASENYVKSINDKRITFIKHQNMGLSKSLNKAFYLANGKYIFRNDQDDISEPYRIEKQLDILKNSDFDCLFSYISKISEKGEWYNLDKVFTRDGKIKKFDPWVDGAMLNSTMAIKKSVFLDIGGYRQEYYPSDDWDLELRLSQKYNVGILMERLVKYRFHDNANTYKYWSLMQNNRRWAEVNYYNRVRNEPEIKYSQYLEEEKRHIYTYYNRRRKDKSKLYMRKAGNYFLEKNYIRMFQFLFLSTVFDPRILIKRLFHLFHNRLSQ